ncbi:MAG: photosystem I protein PsaX [Oscillatoriales cyanobacterium RM1_1_9]|nr:photosystem I protein PsaX [Oscillatoriales cyanobacterium SM2_3_0]NJO44864.1 photosystem I protein PsaX [Oscillatoriales cyanobacterium RM2_1_1]NJO70636.1 photosystem I protein PsaX [Oscillatoriales cyanobacterium RM1_1_9]
MSTDTHAVNKAGGQFPYPFRLFWAILLLAGNLLVAYFYAKGTL